VPGSRAEICCEPPHTQHLAVQDLSNCLPLLSLCHAGSTYFDSLQQEARFVTTTNDPAGFTIIDTFAWGALG
jgi:hypothetical protein